MPIPAGLPERLVAIREKNGYTRKRLAEELGRPYRTLTNYEMGEREPGHTYIIEIAKKFGVTTDYILGLTDSEKNDTKKSPDTAEAAPGDETISFDESNKLLVALGYITEGEDLSDADLAFLTHIIALLDAWFDQRHQGAVDQAGMPA